MSRIDESVHPELLVFVEDRESEVVIRELLAADAAHSDLLTRIHIVPAGPANVVQMLGRLSSEQRLPYKALSFLDADSTESPGTVLLPGTDAPERQVFHDLKNAEWPQIPERLGVGAGSLFTILEDAMLEPDHHKWTAIVGDRVRKSSAGVWDVLASEWARQCVPDAERKRVATAVEEALGSVTAVASVASTDA